MHEENQTFNMNVPLNYNIFKWGAPLDIKKRQSFLVPQPCFCPIPKNAHVIEVWLKGFQNLTCTCNCLIYF
jgi:hypothetical protein